MPELDHLSLFSEIEKAQKRIHPHIHRTPLLFSAALSRRLGAEIYLKMECWQLCGCFKIRGAVNFLASLSAKERSHGLVTCSSGNHGAALSFAAKAFGGVRAKVFVPENAEFVKTSRIEIFGGDLVRSGKDYSETLKHAVRYAKESGAVFVHSHSDASVIAGQGTIGMEILADLPNVEIVIVPVGGGGLISGIVTSVKGLSRTARVYGVESTAAPGAYLSFRDGQCHEQITITPSIADGLMGTLTPLTFALTYNRVSQILTVSDEQIAESMRTLYNEEQITVEGSAAVGLAAIEAGAIDVKGKKTVLVLTGRNIGWTRYRSLLDDNNAEQN